MPQSVITASAALRVDNGLVYAGLLDGVQVEYQACENAAIGEVFWAVRIGSLTYPINPP